MPEADYILERRVELLAEALSTRVNILTEAIAPRGSRPMFTEQLSKANALKFWQRHRYDDIGAKALEFMSPEDVMELDQALSQANEPGQVDEVAKVDNTSRLEAPGGQEMFGGGNAKF